MTTLGANTFSMASAGPFLAYGIFKLCEKIKVHRKVSIFLACCLGDLFTYCITSFQLALAYPSEVGGFAASLVKFLGIFAATQVPLAVIEGILSVVIMIALESFANSELRELGYLKEVPNNVKKCKNCSCTFVLCVVIAVVPMIFWEVPLNSVAPMARQKPPLRN